MNHDLDTGWTLRHLIRRVAEEYGCAGQTGPTSDIPRSAHDLDKVKRAVNFGYREFIAADPDWSFRNRTYRVVTNAAGTGPMNVNGNAGVYRLPRFVQRQPERDLQYTDATYPLGMLSPISLQEITRLLQVFRSPSPPTSYHFQRVSADDGFTGDASGGQWIVTLFPTPNAQYTFQGSAYVYPYSLVEMNEQHIAGTEHDLTIFAFAMKAMFQNPHEDQAKRTSANEYAAQMLAFSKDIDLRARVGMRGVVRDPLMRMRSIAANRIFPGDASTNFTYNGQPLT